MISVDAIVRAQHCSSIGNAQSNVERHQVAFLHSPFRDDGIHEVAACLLIVYREVLNISEDVLRLHSLEQVAAKRSRQDRVFPEILEGAAIAWFARQVHAATQGVIETLCSHL